MIVRQNRFPWLLGYGPMMSTLMSSNRPFGGTGVMSGEVVWRLILTRWHWGHFLTKSLQSRWRCGQTKLAATRKMASNSLSYVL